MEAFIWKALNILGLVTLAVSMGYLWAVALTTVN